MYEGVNASDGIGIGVARVAVEPDLSFTPHAPEDAKAEEERYQAAVAKFIEQTNAQIERMTKTVGEEAAAIMGAHIEFAEDEGIRDMVNGSIESGMCAEQAVSEAYDMYYNMFSNMEDELFRERAADVADVKTGLLADLLGQELVDLSTLPENSIVVVRELTPSMTADIDKDNVAGIVTETGGRTSHSAIIARALEIPAVLSVADATSNIKNGDMVVVDGTNGKVIPTPSDHDLEHYRAKAKQYAEEKLALEAYRGKETVTADGEKKLLVANIGNPDDANVASEHDCEGVGLFRSEFLFMDAKELPSEDEQFAAYQKVALRMKDQPVIIRTLDVGGDKDIPYLHLEQEENPFLGYRAVRYCLGNQDAFRTQLTALMRAGADSGGQLWIMIPMVTTVAEIKQVRQLAEDISQKTGLPLPKIGTMIETPSAMLMADVLAKYCDFFSIGTNDLIQYLMAADRGNPNVAYLYQPCDPAVLRAIQAVIQAGARAGIPVGLCGEMASDAMLTPVLLGFGLERFSVSPSAILNTRREISRWSIQEAQKVAKHVLTLETAAEVAAYLAEVRKR